MLKLLVIAYILSASLFAATISNATLIDMKTSQGHVVYDDVADKYWIWDLSKFTMQTYQEQIDTISTLNYEDGYLGINTWHMASLSELNTLFSYKRYFAQYTEYEVVYKFNPSIYIGRDYYGNLYGEWFGRYDELSNYTRNGVTYHYAAGEWKSIHYNPDIITPHSYIYPDNTPGFYVIPSAWVTASVPIVKTETIPTPEPSTFILFGAGCAGLFLLRRR